MSSYVTRARLDELADRLGPRDWAILDTLAQVRLATAVQLEALHFSEIKASAAPRVRRRVLQRLTEQRLLARLDRRIGGVRAGSSGFVYALDVAGQRLMLGAGPTGGRARKPWTPSPRFVDHRLGVTQVYVDFMVAARARPDVEIVEYETEPEAWRPWPDVGGGLRRLKPDAFLLLHHGQWEERRFIEFDRATEGSAQLRRQLQAYAAYFNAGVEQRRHGVFPRVLWLVPDADRAEQLIDLASREPPETWQLHQVVTHDRAVSAVLGDEENEARKEEIS